MMSKNFERMKREFEDLLILDNRECGSRDKSQDAFGLGEDSYSSQLQRRHLAMYSWGPSPCRKFIPSKINSDDKAEVVLRDRRMCSVSVPRPTTLFIVDYIQCIASSPTCRTYTRVALWNTVFPYLFGRVFKN